MGNLILDHQRRVILGSKLKKTFPVVLSDGNTVAWYDYTQATTIIKDGSNLVSRWNDRLLSGRDLIQANGTNQPLLTADGVLFDGVDNFMQTAAFTYQAPQFIYLVVNQRTWFAEKGIVCGLGATTMLLYQANISGSPNVSMYGNKNLTLAKYSDFNVNTWAILRCLFNGANSKLQTNNLTAITGDVGTSSTAGGITLGAWNTPKGYGNVEFKEAIFRKVADNSTDETAIYNYLKNKYGL